MDVYRNFTELKAAEQEGVEILLPSDSIVAGELSQDAEGVVEDAFSIPPGRTGFDIGPETVRVFGEAIDRAKSLVWTGPMGAYEFAPFAEGTIGIAEAIASSAAFSVIGGGETGEAVSRFGFADRVSYISTGGGACLAVLRGRRLPALDALLA